MPDPADWFQPWPRDALFSVGRKFLSEMDLGSDGIRAAIERFLPLSFKVVNTAAEAFKNAERRFVTRLGRRDFEAAQPPKLLFVL